MGSLINLEQISRRNARVHRKIEEFEYFQYLDRDRLPTVGLLVRAAAVLMALLISA